MCVVTACHVWGSASVLRQTAGQLHTGSAMVKELSSSFRVGPSRAAEGLGCLGVAETL